MSNQKPKKSSSENTRIAILAAAGAFLATVIIGFLILNNANSRRQLEVSTQTNTLAQTQPPAPTLTPSPQPGAPPGVYVWLNWPDEDNTNYDIDIKIETELPDTKTIFWAHKFLFKNGPGGYIGLQIVEGKPKAIFSISEAVEGSQGCETFSGEGTGVRCLIDYAWKPGKTYRLRVRAEIDEGGQLLAWQGAVYDYAADQEVLIGRIAVPEDRGYLSPLSVTWTEYVGYTSCEVPLSEATWSNPLVRNASGESSPLKATVAYGDSGCAQANVDTLGEMSYRLRAGGEVKQDTEDGTQLWP